MVDSSPALMSFHEDDGDGEGGKGDDDAAKAKSAFPKVRRSLFKTAHVNMSVCKKVTEISLLGLGASGKRPLLLARTDDHELLVYEAFRHHGQQHAKQQQHKSLKIRFKKIRHGLLLRERKGK